MTKELFEKIIQKADGNVAEYVINYYWEMSKSDLRDCVSEIAWVAIRSLNRGDAETFNKEVLESIKENRIDED